MVQPDWNRILSVNVASLSDEEIEDICPMVIQCDVDDIDNLHNLRTLFKLSQEILQYKDHQVESLLLECSELKQAISALKPEASKRRKKDHVASEMKQDVEVFGKRSTLPTNSNYEDALKGKNKKISALMQELESLDKENELIKNQLTSLGEEMRDATEKMNEMTEELSSLRMENSEYKESVTVLEYKNAALVSQIEEITNQQVDRDKVIDDFGAAIDSRISEWKNILDEKDAEIINLRTNLSQYLLHSATSVMEENQSDIVKLKDEIKHRDEIIIELQSKLSEATVEINNGVTLIERLKSDAKKPGEDDARNGDSKLLSMLEDANEKMSTLETAFIQVQDGLKLKSSDLCEALSVIRKYEKGNDGLTEALDEIKDLKHEIDRKNEHIEDLVNIVNNLEMLNCYQEMEIITLREKLGIPEGKSLSIENTVLRCKEEASRLDKFMQENKVLLQENLEMKSDIRILKYQLYKSATTSDISHKTLNDSTNFLHSTKLLESDQNGVSGVEHLPLHHKTYVDELKKNIQIVIEENEALRTGMHEILDSIRNQDGESIVEVQSSTLERLLEALDVRHLAGWYHPAMRLQEQLNVVQGSNAELRSQVKELRKELQKKDNILQELATHRDHNIELAADEFECDNITKYVSEIQNLQTAYQNEAEEWGKQKESLIIQSDELKSTINMLESKLNIYEENWKILELGDNEVQKAFAEQSEKYAACINELLNINKKNAILQELVDKETAKLYLHDKEATKKIFDLKKAVVDSDKREKALESKLSMLQNNLVNSRSNVEFNELKEKYEQLNVRLRNMLEHNLSIVHDNTVDLLRHELEVEKQEKQLLIQHFQKIDSTNDDDLAIQLKEAVANLFTEKQRADHISRLHEMSKAQSANFEIRITELTNTITELREQMSKMYKSLCMELDSQDVQHVHTDEICVLQHENTILKVENENLKQSLLISQDEVKVQYTVNSLKLLELDSLRHQVLDLQAISEDKAIISRLDFELMRTKVSEVELNAQKVELESEVSHLRREVEKLRNKCDELQQCINESQKIYINRCRTYVNVITFLQCQYAGYASTSTLERIVNISMKLQEDRSKLQFAMDETKQCQADVKLQQELLCNRLRIVESLMDILEQQIGGINVQTLMQHFSENSQHMVADFKNKRKIAHLEYELEVANNKCVVYDLTIVAMEQEVIDMQKAWRQQQEYLARSDIQLYDRKPELVERRSVLIQATTETNSTTIQTDPYICCLNGKANAKTNEKANGEQGEKEKGTEEMVSLTQFEENSGGVISGNTGDVMEKDESSPNKTVQKSKASNETLETAKHTLTDTNNTLVIVNDQLNQALKLASDRSAALMKYELQVTEYQVKVDALSRAIEEKDLQLAQKGKELEYYNTQSQMVHIDGSDKLALKSSINSLQKIIDQKESTIQRYQNLLKEDRDEHNQAISGFQEEIKNLHMRFLLMQNDDKQCQEQSDVNLQANKSKVEKVGQAPMERVQNNNTSKDDEIARLHENVSTLETDLTMMKDLSERWHRLAEERLSHMDRMREKLEQQHEDELESYRTELNRWQSEAHMLRKQLSDNRMMLTKGNISLMKELQERDDKIHELSLTCQQLQNEVDISRLQYTTPMQRDGDMKLQDVSHSISREHLQHSNSDLGRRQLYAYIEKEKMYKHEITQLKRQLSHRYMAAKTQDKKISQREVRLDRKVKSLEEELSKAKSQLDREFLAQEMKRAKTAEELSLWEKQKKWQQSAEKLKEKLKDKTEECAKLQTNYEKLRSVVLCLEREKWYLKSKLKAENVNVGETLSTKTMSTLQHNVSEVLEKECQVLRERVKELTNGLNKKDDSEELLLIMEEQKRRINTLEIVTQGSSYVVDQLQRLEVSTSMVERANLKLESENLELRLELEKICSETPRLREKIDHLEKYIDLLKMEKGLESTPRLSDKELHEIGVRKTAAEMEKTIFTLKRIVEKLQGENKRLKINTKKDGLLINQGRIPYSDNEQILHRHYEEAQKRVIALETDLQLAEQRIIMLEKSQREYENTESRVLKQQLIHKSELLDKVKQLLTRAAVNEKTLRQRIQQLESRQTLSTIPECYVSLPTPE